ncbi:uncharacterized protein B0H18DRAFT_1114956 [Fomitopsis serialis]|uniref:uncharacterized protein n=1 Tax=Fomitopsis serialis TaxID=139415 RepID=UPI0020079386|nr:uncharacterized protein B0H18DRAFT_1114956 [Neoantrodia serialis]KAH9934216.1 hypothetical protein B0H18DRAFT_1114956 [Neoantrodia serialis]
MSIPHKTERVDSGAPEKSQKNPRQDPSPESPFAACNFSPSGRFAGEEIDKWNRESEQCRGLIMGQSTIHAAGVVSWFTLDAVKLVDSDPDFKQLLFAAGTSGDFRPVIKAEALLPEHARIHTFGSQASKEAAVKSWQQEFRGTTDALYAVIQCYMRQGTPQPYARHAAYAVLRYREVTNVRRARQEGPLHPDQLGPVGGNAFPPSDIEARYWLSTRADNQQHYEHRVQAFIHSLFATVLDRLKSIDQDIGSAPDGMLCVLIV